MVTDVPGSVGPEVLVKEIPNWRPGWSQIVMGTFYAIQGANGQYIAGFPQLLFYEAAQGIGKTYGFSGGAGSRKALYRLAHELEADRPGQLQWWRRYGSAVLRRFRAYRRVLAVSPTGDISLMRTMTGWRKFMGSDRSREV